MKAEYKRDLKNNYLIIEAEEKEQEENYCLHMAEQNAIPGLLSFHSSRTDGKLYLQYEITSKQPLDQMYERTPLSGAVLLGILQGIAELLDALQVYLLNPAQILFDPQYIYVCTEQKTLQFCYLPGEVQERTIDTLADFFLKHLDHEDFSAVEIGYQFYQCVQEENFSLKKTLKNILVREREKERKKEKDKKKERKILQTPEEEAEYGLDSPTEYENAQEKELKKRKAESLQQPGKRNLYDGESGVYTVTHKERKSSEGKERKVDRVFRLIHPAILISGLFLMILLELVYYYGWLSLTETGGLFFLIISVETLMNQLWRKRREQEKRDEFRWISEEEDAVYRMLKEEMYDEEIYGEKMYDEKIHRENSYAGKTGSERMNETMNSRRMDLEHTVNLGNDEIAETRFLGDTEKVPQLRLIPVKEQGKAYRNGEAYPEIIVGREPVLIGKRRGESDVLLDSPTVSRTHALLERRDGVYFICDLNSKNGTFCNGERLEPQEKRMIENGDRISFAEIEYRAVQN